jgi:hypothetical protein
MLIIGVNNPRLESEASFQTPLKAVQFILQNIGKVFSFHTFCNYSSDTYE